MNHEFENLIKEIENLKLKAEAMREKYSEKKKNWPQIGDEFWIIGITGEIRKMKIDKFDDIKWIKASEEAHETREQAKAALERILKRQEIIDMLDELNDGWVAELENKEQEKCSPDYYDREDDRLTILTWDVTQTSKYIAKSREIWDQITKKFGDKTVAECLGVI